LPVLGACTGKLSNAGEHFELRGGGDPGFEFDDWQSTDGRGPHRQRPATLQRLHDKALPWLKPAAPYVTQGFLLLIDDLLMVQKLTS
jgi:hypothetical protein